MDNKKMLSIFFAAIIFILVVMVITSCWYTVDQSQQAFIVTLGKPDPNIKPAGLHFKLPYPIQEVKIYSRETFSLTFGYDENGNRLTVHEKESKMVTGDENIILADLEVQWRIIDPIAFAYNTQNPQNILYNAASASLRSVIGSSGVDKALTDGRTEIMNDVRDSLTAMVDLYDAGIGIVNINLQDVDLPNDEVSAAFRKVTDAREERNTKVNQANRYKNEKINVALGEKNAIISRAEGQKIARIQGAMGDVAKFDAIYSEYANNKGITQERLIIEVLEEILPSANIYIMADDSSTLKHLPLQSLFGGDK